MTVISGGTALVGEAFEPIENASISIGGEVIEAIEEHSSGDEVDARGLTLIPGFIDSHVHVGLADPKAILWGGVTTVRDLGWPPEIIFPLAERSEDPGFEGPRIVAAGPMLTVEGGYPTKAAWAPPGTGRVVRSRDDAAAAVEEVAGAGGTIVKVALNAEVGPTLSLDYLRAIVGTATQMPMKVTGHIYGLDELNKALEANMYELAHMLMSPERIPDETLGWMLGWRMCVVPTLSIRDGRDLQIAIDNLRRFAERGGTIVYGTDLGNQGPEPGIDRREIEAMASAGLTGRQILASGTTDAAGWLELDDSGVLLAGKRADVVGVVGDPLEDPMALTKVKLVVRGGRVVRAERH